MSGLSYSRGTKTTDDEAKKRSGMIINKNIRYGLGRYVQEERRLDCLSIYCKFYQCFPCLGTRIINNIGRQWGSRSVAISDEWRHNHMS